MAGVPLRSIADVEAYYRARKRVQIGGFITAIGALVSAAGVALSDGPLWLLCLFAVWLIPCMLVTSGWVPKRLRVEGEDTP